MNELPDNLWWSEHVRTRANFQSASDVDEVIGPYPCTIESTVPWAVVGMSIILSCFAVTALAGAMVGSSLTLKLLRQKGIGYRPGKRHAMSESSVSAGSGLN